MATQQADLQRIADFALVNTAARMEPFASMLETRSVASSLSDSCERAFLVIVALLDSLAVLRLEL